ncbi:hypothetical protein QBC35DRAFT_487815 [Podospora australis]|uniref:Methyltransferase type 11 domain-containing protein n=1 Tax=Podospora australis TaxID=1536484 RepID=A0AAN7AM79_9PEZI|nr:hypothetical protein QBC35DRAFT_487815 [Podospora australis]
MEFLSGYAAAKAPFSAYTVEPHHPPSQRSNRPGRSNSTSGTTTKKRSRIHGHVRTNSASTSSSGRTDNNHNNNQAPPPPPNNAAWLQPPGGLDTGVEAASSSSSSAASPVNPATHHHRSRRDLQRDRVSASPSYWQDKQLPATPRLNTFDASSRYLAATGSASEPASARTPASAISSHTFPEHHRRGGGFQQHAAMFDPGAPSKGPGGASSGLPRTESVTSVSGNTTASGRTMISTEPPSSAEAAANHNRPFVVRNGRTYISDQSLPYPLPVDLEELHRQSLKTMLLLQLFGRPICNPAFINKPPPRILEVGCGTGFWSMMCYKYYEARGQGSTISFTGLDIAPLAPTSGGNGSDNTWSNSARQSTSSAAAGQVDTRPDKDMNWRFVQHDIRKLPLPFPDGSFDLVMAKDMGLATSVAMEQSLLDEYIRLLVPGGALEVWETDHTLRMLRPHVPSELGASGEEGDSSGSEDEQKEVTNMGAYVMTPNTPLSAPTNNFLIEYNTWVSRALEARGLLCMPCTVIGPILIQEAEVLTGVGSRRLAVPLSEVRWEREGVGGVVTKDGKSYIETKAKRVGKDGVPVGRALEPAAAAVRRTALTVVVQQIQSMESILREVSGKSQDEWDGWMGKMMNDLVRENGTSWGECLEAGAWWAMKK